MAAVIGLGGGGGGRCWHIFRENKDLFSKNHNNFRKKKKNKKKKEKQKPLKWYFLIHYINTNVVTCVSFIFYTGAILTLSSYPSHAIMNQPIALTCTVSHATGLVDLIEFRRRTSYASDAMLKQHVNKCTEEQLITLHLVDSNYSNTKKYIPFIHKVSASEVTEWLCRLINQ